MLCSRVDEVQYAPDLFRYLKVTVDAGRMQNGQFLLTGSVTGSREHYRRAGPCSSLQFRLYIARYPHDA